MAQSRRLAELASVIRSKNAGPFELTFDIIFESRENYEIVKRSGSLTRQTVTDLYGTSDNEILTFEFFDLVPAIKITIPRPRKQGSIGETDMHGSQQYLPLRDLPIATDR